MAFRPIRSRLSFSSPPRLNPKFEAGLPCSHKSVARFCAALMALSAEGTSLPRVLRLFWSSLALSDRYRASRRWASWMTGVQSNGRGRIRHATSFSCVLPHSSPCPLRMRFDADADATSGRQMASAPGSRPVHEVGSACRDTSWERQYVLELFGLLGCIFWLEHELDPSIVTLAVHIMRPSCVEVFCGLYCSLVLAQTQACDVFSESHKLSFSLSFSLYAHCSGLSRFTPLCRDVQGPGCCVPRSEVAKASKIVPCRGPRADPLAAVELDSVVVGRSGLSLLMARQWQRNGSGSASASASCSRWRPSPTMPSSARLPEVADRHIVTISLLSHACDD